MLNKKLQQFAIGLFWNKLEISPPLPVQAVVFNTAKTPAPMPLPPLPGRNPDGARVRRKLNIQPSTKYLPLQTPLKEDAYSPTRYSMEWTTSDVNRYSKIPARWCVQSTISGTMRK